MFHIKNEYGKQINLKTAKKEEKEANAKRDDADEEKKRDSNNEKKKEKEWSDLIYAKSMKNGLEIK